MRLSHVEGKVLRRRKGRRCCYGLLGMLVAVEAAVKGAVQSRWSVAITAGCKEAACAASRVAIKVVFKTAGRMGMLFAIMASAVR